MNIDYWGREGIGEARRLSIGGGNGRAGAGRMVMGRETKKGPSMFIEGNAHFQHFQTEENFVSIRESCTIRAKISQFD